MRLNHLSCGCAAALMLGALTETSSAGLKKEEHFDIWLEVADGSFRTGRASEDETEFLSDFAVFGAELGEDMAFPFSADEPGFQLLDGALDPFQQMTFDVLSTVGKWNGAGFDDALETFTIGFEGSQVTTGVGLTPGFTFSADAAGGFHTHFGYTLNGIGDDDPMNGIYLLEMQIGTLDGTVGTSNPFFIVFNLGLDEVMHEMAIEYVEGNLVPAPSAMALLLIGALGARRRK